MLSLSSRLARNHVPQRTALAAAAAAAAAALSAAATLQQQQHEQPQHSPPWTPITTTTRTLCEGGALLSFPFRMRRHSTVEKMQTTAAKEYSLEDRYRVQWQEPVGTGAFGKVYSAIDTRTGETVAVKEISKRYTNDDAFQREMDALLEIRDNGGHPNICGLRENFDSGDYYYIVMDFVGGREMFEQLCDNGPYSEADAARHVRETASALAFLHGIGIIHTDVKPENCLLSSKETSDAVIKVVDLGCAHRVGVEPTHEQRLKGTANTPAYCPPEVLLESQERQHHDKLHSHVTIAPPFDMWSLGVVIYTMLVGAHPYDLRGDATDEEIARKIMSGKKPPLRNFKYARHLSEDAMSLIEGLMETDPSKRLTADQVLDNPWVLGETASHKAIANSDRRLAEQHRKCKTKIGSTFFKTLLSQTDAIHGNSTTERAPVLELAFRRLDTGKSGYLSTGGGDCAKSKLSLSDVSSLLAENMKNRYFSKSHVIYKEGQEGDSMYLISSGTVELTTKDGFVKTRGSGEIFGEDIMSKSKVHSSTVECKTPVHVLEIPRELYEKYVASDRETFLSMAETDRHRRRERASTILNLNKQCRSQSFKKGDAIFQEGQKGNKLYMLQDGHVDITVHGHKVRSLKIGEMTGEHAAYHYKPYNVTATCLSDSCEMRVLPSRVMHRLFKSDPSLREDFRELMMRRDFKKAVCTAIGKPFPTSHEEIQAAFQAIDKDKSGEISFEELKELVLRFDPTYNEEDIQYMHESLDLSNTQQVTWEEFRRIFAMDKEA